MLDFLSLRDSHCVEHTNQPLGTEQSHQIILQGNIKLRFAGVSLTSGTSSQLVINTSRLVPFRTDNLKAARRSRFLVELDVRTTACHVCRNCHRTVHTCVCDDLRLQFMELRVQHLMLDTPALEHTAQLLTRLDRDRADQYGLPLRMRRLDSVNDSVQLLLLRLIYRILKILTDDRTVRGNDNNIHAVNLTELLLLRQRRTRHTALLLEKIKEILERDGCKCLALSLYLYMLLCLDRLMQTVGITASRHDTPGKLIDNQNLIVLNHIVLIAEHQIVRAKCQNDGMLYLQILRIGKVINMEKFLDLLHTGFGQVDYLILLIYDKVTVLLLNHAHDGIHLRQLLYIVAALHAPCKQIAHLIQSRGLSALTRNNQRCSRLIDQYRVHLVDDAEMQISQHQLLLVDYHVVTQIIKAELVVCHIGNITAVSLLTLLAGHAVQHDSDRQAQKFMYLPHPLSVTLCQIVVDRYDMDALALQRIQISRCGRYQRLSFTGTHLGDTSLVQNDSTDQLYAVMLHVQDTARSLSHRCKRFRQQIVQRLSFSQSLFVFIRLAPQLLVRQRLHRRAELLDFIYQRHDSLQFPVTVCTEYLVNNLHDNSHTFPSSASITALIRHLVYKPYCPL